MLKLPRFDFQNDLTSGGEMGAKLFKINHGLRRTLLKQSKMDCYSLGRGKSKVWLSQTLIKHREL